MRIPALLVLCFLISISVLKAQKACPVNFDNRNLELAAQNVDAWKGKTVAFNATVLEVQQGYKEKPYYKVAVEGGGELWVASTINSGFETTDNRLRILGYFSDIENDDSVAMKYNKTKYHVLAFTVINLATKKMSIHPGAKLSAEEWLNGIIPEPGK